MTKQQRAEKAKLHKVANILSNWNVCFEEGDEK